MRHYASMKHRSEAHWRVHDEAMPIGLIRERHRVFICRKRSVLRADTRMMNITAVATSRLPITAPLLSRGPARRPAAAIHRSLHAMQLQRQY